MNVSRPLLTLLFMFLVSACSEPETRTFPSGDDAGAEPPLDFPLGESPETLVACEANPPNLARLDAPEEIVKILFNGLVSG